MDLARTDLAGTQAATRIVLGRSASAFLVAFAVGAVAFAAPPAALLLLALLAARVLMRADAPPQLDLAALAGPAFAALLAGLFVGLPGAVGVLFVWRLYVDTRWSAREAARLAVAAGQPGQTRRSAQAHLWLTPLYGLAIVAYTAPHMVAGLPLDLPHVPAIAPTAVGFIAGAAFFDWALRRAADWRLGDLAPAPAAHALAHHSIFLLAFGLMLDVSAGLVALIAWRLAHAAPLALPSTRPV